MKLDILDDSSRLSWYVEPDKQHTMLHALDEHQVSIDETIGSDWKQKCAPENLEEALGHIGIRSLEDGEEITDDDPEHIKLARDRITERSETYQVKKINSPSAKGGIGLFITNKIGDDTVYCTCDNITHQQVLSSIEISTCGIINDAGDIFSIDRFLLPTDDKTQIKLRMFFAPATDSHLDFNSKHPICDTFRDNFSGRFLHEIKVFFPESGSDFGALFHEIGHSIRRQSQTSEYLWNHYHLFHQIREKLSKLSPEELGEFEQYIPVTESIDSQEERGAWAIAIKVLHYLSSIDFSCLAPEIIKDIQLLSERKLDNYDNSSLKPNQSPHPYSRKQRNKLHQITSKN